MQGFIFGGDTGETPESIARKRKIADAMFRANSAPKNVGEGLSAIGNALAAKYMQRKATDAETKGREEASAAFAAALGGSFPGAYTPGADVEVGTPFNPAGSSRASSGGSFIDRIIQAESAGDPSAVSPKGAGGLMQIMPDTARDPGYGVPNIYETAQQFGLTPPSPDATDAEMTAWLADPANVDANEAFGTNYANAMQAKFGEGTPEAAAAYNAGPGAVEKFGGVPPYPETQGYVQKVAGNWSPEVAQAAIDGSAPAAPQGQAIPPNGGMQQGIQISPQLIEALSNPWLSDAQKSVLGALVQKQIGGGESLSPYQMAQLGLSRERLDLERQRLESSNNRGGFRIATPEEAAGYGASGGQFGPDGRFYPINPPSGMSIESDGNGGFRVVQGPGASAKPFTESQSKDNVYSTRARGALPTLNEMEGALASYGDKMMDMDPTGVVRGNFQSPEYQVARAAADEFLQAILRKDTGAAITAQEQELYGRTYLPQPGDGPDVIAYKREARQRAVDAIASGMSPSQMVAVERALAKDNGVDLTGGGAEPKPRGDRRERREPDAVPEGVDPEDWKYMTEEERDLWR